MAVVRVQVVTRGRETFIKLARADTGKLVAVAPVRQGGPSAIEQVTDSSRYFALRVENASGARGGSGLLLCPLLPVPPCPPTLTPHPLPRAPQALPRSWAWASTSARTRST